MNDRNSRRCFLLRKIHCKQNVTPWVKFRIPRLCGARKPLLSLSLSLKLLGMGKVLPIGGHQGPSPMIAMRLSNKVGETQGFLILVNGSSTTNLSSTECSLPCHLLSPKSLVLGLGSIYIILFCICRNRGICAWMSHALCLFSMCEYESPT